MAKGRANLEKQRLFAEGKARGKTSSQVAREIGISEVTASAWLKLPEVREMIQELQVEAWQESQSQLLQIQGEAVSTLVNLLKSQDETMRFKAAKELLDQCSSFKHYL
jgi:transposase-like protein